MMLRRSDEVDCLVCEELTDESFDIRVLGRHDSGGEERRELARGDDLLAGESRT